MISLPQVTLLQPFYKHLLLPIVSLAVLLVGCKKDKNLSGLHPLLQEAIRLYEAADFETSLTTCYTLQDSLNVLSPRQGYQVQLCLAKNYLELAEIDKASGSLALADSLLKAAPEDFSQKDTLNLEFSFRQAQVQSMLGKEKQARADLQNLPLEQFPACVVKANIYEWFTTWAGQELDSEKARELLTMTEKNWTDLSEKYPQAYFRIPLAKADYFFHQDLPEKALEQLNEAEKEIRARNLGNPVIESKLAYLRGLCYRDQYDFQTAIDHFQEAVALFGKSHRENHPYFMKLYDAIANAYSWARKCDEALEFYDKALQVEAPPLPFVRKEKALIQHNKGVLFMNCGAYSQAKSAYEESIENIEQEKNNFIGLDKFLITARSNRATLDYYYEQYERAIELYQATIMEAEKVIGPKNSYIAQPYLNMAACYMALAEQANNDNEQQIAAAHYKNAVYASDKCLEALNFQPDSPEPFATIYSPKSSQYSLWNRAESYLGLYYVTDDPQWLYKAQEDFRLSVDFLDVIRQGFWEELSYLGFAADNKVVYEKAIKTNFDLYQNFDREKSRLDYCFEMTEKGKGLLLLDVVSKNGIEQDRLFSSALFSLESELRREIQRLENRKELQIDTEDSQIDRALFAKKREYQNVLAEIKEKDPKYFNYRFNTETMPLSEAQSLARQENATLINYFLGSRSYYALVVNPNDIDLIPIDISPQLTAAIGNFPGLLSRAWQNGNNRDKINAADSIAHQGLFLYRQLLEPLVPFFSSDKLIIIPDDILGYLPFDALHRNEVQNPQAYHQYDYLIRDFRISYAHSVSLLGQMKDIKIKTGTKSWLGIAPSYVAGQNQDSLLSLLRDGLLPLQYNQASVKALLTKTAGDVLTGAQATKSRFLQLAPDYRVLHFSMHAGIDDALEKAGFLAFHNDFSNVSDFLLYVREIYPIELHADMVVLSACETNLGQLKYGEGIINLARAFSYAGAKSVFTTLWKVDDKASMELMQSFYDHLQDKPKDEALRLARLSLMENPNYTAPFYWAAFKPIGDMEKISW